MEKTKHKLNVLENNTTIVDHKLKNMTKDVAETQVKEAAQTGSIDKESPSKKQLVEAIFQRILSSPVFMVSKLNQSDINIAKVYIYSDSGVIGSIPIKQVEEIKRRISIYERCKDKNASSSNKIGTEEMSSHPGLRSALDKCVKQRYTDLTLEDLESIRKYYEAITAIETLASEDQKRLQLLLKSMEKINEYLCQFPKP